MKKKILGVLVGLLAVAILTVSISAVLAKNNPKFIPVSGVMTSLGTGTMVPTPAGKSHTTKLGITDNSLVWSGSFENSISIASGHWTIQPKGHFPGTLWNVHTMTAEFMGKSGTITMIGSMGHWRIIGGTGDFANVHGQGTTTPIVMPVMWSYEGQIHFDP